MKELSYRMELVGAPVPELKSLLTTSFEQWDGEGSGIRSCALSGGVAPDDPESNFGLAERMLLSPLGAKAPHAIRMPAENADLDQAARWYDHALATALNDGPLDLAILGVGEDGHICSLFPGHKALLQDDLRAVAIEDAPKPPPRRLSLSMPFVLQTKKIWVIAIGPRKLPVLQAAVDKTSRSTPLDLLMRQAKDVTVFTDQTLRRR
jgi:6-phosphogluconolactonase/glucosamine-6-phosphate isomerase/deaminase